MAGSATDPHDEANAGLRYQGRLVTNDDTGLKVLREAPAEAEAAQIIEYVHFLCLLAQTYSDPPSIVAVHGLGAHPDDSWCRNVGTRESPRWVNWLEEESMLPVVAPNARIMRYGYQSQWFGKEAMQQSAFTVAERLLRALKRKRKVPTVSDKRAMPADYARIHRSVRCYLWRTALAGWSCLR
jgi:hypothetical protein